MATKKHILVDLLRLKYINTGLGQVCLAYGAELSKIRNPHFQFTFLVPHNFAGYFGDHVNYIVPAPIKHFLFPRRLSKPFDLWHAVHQDIHYYPYKHIPLVFTVHDLNFIREKTRIKIRLRKNKLNFFLQRAAQTIAISNYTKQDIEINLSTKSPIEVIYNGVNLATEVKEEPPAFIDTNHFLLAIGVFKPNKNYQSLVRLMNEYPEKRLIIAGAHNTAYGKTISEMIRKKGLQDRVITPGIISEADKVWLYAHCEALLFPSTNEGMGLPIIEAMRFGKPVIAARQSSIPEFGREYAYYFSSFEPAAMRQSIEESLTDYRRHPERMEEIKRYSEQFSWKKHTQQYIQLFERLLGIS
ncbi:MAG: glycosyltransferase family 4 protein [Dysgonamonadaceae bacterium]|jgi:glycosyltransferase involved in cell wall biosynthesis|nr:glycosyltransferase family 4 protein [Dysgonamonadaceae bacterium]